MPPSGAARLVGDQWVLMPVGASGFQVTDPAYFTTFYQTTDCSGDAYLPADSSTTTVCPWKGTASYYHVVIDGKRNENAAWYYAEPKAAAAQIKDHIAFWKGVKVQK